MYTRSTTTLVESLEDIAVALREEGGSGLELLQVSDDFVELQRGEQRALLALPRLWRDAGRLGRLLAAPASGPPTRQQQLPSLQAGLTGLTSQPDQKFDSGHTGHNALRPRATLLVCLGAAGELTDIPAAIAAPCRVAVPWPVPVTTLVPLLASMLELASRYELAEARGRLAERFKFEVGELISIAAAINSERDTNRLLELILEKSRYVTGADAGSIYVLVPHPERPEEQLLRFAVAQNDSVPVDFKSFTLEVSRRSIVGTAVLGRRIINIPDLDGLTPSNPWGGEHNRSIDRHTGYCTRSVLTVPLITQRDDVIGVLQLINKKLDPARTLRSKGDFEEVVPFDDHAVSLCQTLATQAAISLETALLYGELKLAFEGFVNASIGAIESRDPTTSGHSRRVADLTVALAEAVDHCEDEPFRDIHFSAAELQEIEYAGLLHDFGKIGVPEPVLIKARKLHDWELELILARFSYVRARLELESERKKVELALCHGPEAQSRFFPAVEDARRKQQEYLDLCVETVLRANDPSVRAQPEPAFLGEIASHTYIDPQGEPRPYLTQKELDCLRIPQGSLSWEERRQIESHVVHSYAFLCTIPWGRALRRIPVIASDHHEKLDGSGYPQGKRGGEIPIQARMMCIADIFDALTAADRPYKRSVPLDRALHILEEEVTRGRLDPHLYRLFVHAQVFRCVLK